MSKSKPYRVCPTCGGNLDPGERCDCEIEKHRDAAEETAKSAGMKATADRREPVLMYGA